MENKQNEINMKQIYRSWPTIKTYNDNRAENGKFKNSENKNKFKENELLLLHKDNTIGNEILKALENNFNDHTKIDDNYDKKSGIYVYIKPEIKTENDNDILEFIENLFDSYRHYGKQNGTYQKLESINMRSKLYTQSPITDVEPIYTLFTIFQYNLNYELLKYFSSPNYTQNIPKKVFLYALSNTVLNNVDLENSLVSSNIYQTYILQIQNDSKGLNFKTNCEKIKLYMDTNNWGEIAGHFNDKKNKGFIKSYSFENYKLMLEIRSYQIKRYYMLYVIVTFIYDIWFLKKNGNEITKDILMNRLNMLFPDYFTNDDIIIDLVWSAMDGFIHSRTPNNIDYLCTNINIHLQQHKTELLNSIKVKYDNALNNFNMYLVFVTHRYYLLFEKHINKLIEKLKIEVTDLFDNNKINFDPVNDPYKLGIYLQGINFIYFKIDEQTTQTYTSIITDEKNKEEINIKYKENNVIMTKIEDIQAKYTKEDFNSNTLDDDQKVICQTLINSDNDLKFDRIRFIQKFVFVEVATFNSNDQSDPKNIIWIQKYNPKNKNNSKLNKICNIIDYNNDSNDPITIWGLSKDIKPYGLCPKQYITMASFSAKNNFPYMLTLWSHTINHIILYLATTSDKKLLYIMDKTTKRCPMQFIDDMPKYIKSNISKISNKYTYIGVLVIPSSSYTVGVQKKNIILIFKNNITKLYKITDLNGNHLDYGVILYEPLITYHELVQLYKYYKMKHQQLKNILANDVYIFKPENKINNEKSALCINENKNNKL